MKQVLAILWYLWSQRRYLSTLKDEIMDVYDKTKLALNDSRLSKEELLIIIEELNHVLNAIKPLLGVK